MDTHTWAYNNSLFYRSNRMTTQDRTWHAEGNCTGHPDPDLWHYENSAHSDEQQLQVLRSVEAIELCHQCPVKAQCLQQGLEPENIQDWGGWGTIWGGLLTSERYRLVYKSDNSQIVSSERRHRGNVRKKIAKLSV